MRARVFADRREAGRVLAEALSAYADRDDVLVLALPRGGVPVGYEVAERLGAALDVLIVRKLGVPWQPELAMGAIASGGGRVVNDEIMALIPDAEGALERVTRGERAELERRERLYRDERAPLDVRGKTLILVDDGMATGASMRAAVAALRSQDPARIVVAVPTAPATACRDLEALADEVVALSTPSPFMGVGRWYRRFDQTSDEEVRRLLEHAAAPVAGEE